MTGCGCAVVKTHSGGRTGLGGRRDFRQILGIWFSKVMVNYPGVGGGGMTGISGSRW